MSIVKFLREQREIESHATSGKWYAYDWPNFPSFDENRDGCIRIENKYQIVAFCFSGKPNPDVLFIKTARNNYKTMLDAIEIMSGALGMVDRVGMPSPYDKIIKEAIAAVGDLLSKGDV